MIANTIIAVLIALAAIVALGVFLAPWLALSGISAHRGAKVNKRAAADIKRLLSQR